MADAGTDFSTLREAWTRYQMNKDEASRVLVVDLMKKYGIAQSALTAAITDPGEWERINQQMRTQAVTGVGPRAAPQAAAEPVDPREAERANLTKWITEFTQSMGRPVDMNDPVFASLSNMGSARASMGVGQSGIRVGRGGLGEAAIQQGANAAVTPYLQQRQQMYQQGLGMLDQRQQGIERLQQGAQGLEMQRIAMQNGINQQMYGQQADAAGGVGGAVGGAIGTLGGLALNFIPGVGPALSAAATPLLASGGAKLGAGAGMGSVQRPTYQSPRPYGSFGGGRSSGGGY
jgi:hypothetical protein